MTIETIDVDELNSDQIDAAEVIVVSGTNLELRNTGSYVQWHQVGDVTWQNLIALSAISGTNGINGTNGTNGASGRNGTDGASGRNGTDGASGRNGTDGASGANGWTPVFTVVTDSARRVLQVSDWTGGTGTKPTTGQYVGASGFTAILASAVDIRGAAGSNGTNGTNGASGSNGTNGASGASGPAGPGDYNDLASGETVIPRLSETSAAIAAGSGTIRFAYFTARRTETITQLRVNSGTTAGGLATLTRFGLYSVNASTGDLTLIASTASDLTLLRAASTVYTKTLSSSFSKVVGTRYAVAILVVSANTAPTVTGVVGTSAASMGLAPRIAGFANGQTDLPSSLTAASITDSSNVIQMALLP